LNSAEGSNTLLSRDTEVIVESVTGNLSFGFWTA